LDEVQEDKSVAIKSTRKEQFKGSQFCLEKLANNQGFCLKKMDEDQKVWLKKCTLKTQKLTGVETIRIVECFQS
jgi:molybdopterin synthase catalytic subunit